MRNSLTEDQRRYYKQSSAPGSTGNGVVKRTYRIQKDLLDDVAGLCVAPDVLADPSPIKIAKYQGQLEILRFLTQIYEEQSQ